jgi:drug/metabolite transporter (DMT)-like permease
MSNHLKGILMVLSSTAMWGLVGILVQYLISSEYFTPEWLVNTRLLASGIILLVITYIFYEQNIFKVLKTDFISLLLLGVIGLLGSQYGFYICINHSNAPTATILVFLLPVFIMLYTLLVKHKRPSGLELISILFAITGTSLIVTKGDFSSIILSPIALIAGITSALCCVFYTLQPRKVLSKYSSTNVMGWSMLFGGIFISCFNNPLDIPGEINLYTLSAILSMILFGTVLAFCFYLKSLDYLSPTEASILTVGEPLCSIILSLIFLNVNFSSIELMGAVLILSTVFILAKAK